MGLIMEFDGSIEGYEAVPLVLPAGMPGRTGAVLRRRAARPSRRAVLYVHALDDDFVAPDQVTWYTHRGFHFYAADLRSVGAEGPGSAAERPAPGRPASGAAPALPPRPAAGQEPHDVGAPGPGARPAGAVPPPREAPESLAGSGPAGVVNGAACRAEAADDGGAAQASGGVAEPAPWDTATFDAIRFDQAVLDREAFRAGGQHGSGRHRLARTERTAGRTAGRAAAAPAGLPPSRALPTEALVPGPRAGGPGIGALADQRTAAGQHRALPADVTRAAEELGECFACLDAASSHLRENDAIDTVVLAAHSAGALIAALWVHTRRDSRPVDALVLANPPLEGRSWLARMRVAREESAAGRRASPLLTSARRRVRRGLDIGCPVLVMSPAGGEGAAPGRWLGSRFRLGERVPARFGAHVTWLSLEAGLPGQPPAPIAERRRYYEELARWLGAYLSGQVRDQLL